MKMTAPATPFTAPRAAGNISAAETELTNRILQAGNGKGVIKFCRELAVILVRRYAVEDDAAELRSRLCASLIATLQCGPSQAEALIDLALELIHSKTHGAYRRSAPDMGYLIAKASGAVRDVTSN